MSHRGYHQSDSTESVIMERKIYIEAPSSEWMKDLWHYLDAGDGTTCLIKETCERRRNGWCACDYEAKIREAYDIAMSTQSEDHAFKKLVNDILPLPWVPCRPFEAVQTMATRYLEQSGLSKPPVTSEIIKQLHFDLPVEIREVPLKSVRGAVWRLQDTYIIHVNIEDPPGKKRATVFHEMFQIASHRGAAKVFLQGWQLDNGFFNVLLADYFAMAMLMPESWITKCWLQVHDLSRMAEIFQVSEVVMWTRLVMQGKI